MTKQNAPIFLVPHADTEPEYANDRVPHTGKLDRVLDVANRRGCNKKYPFGSAQLE